MGINIACCVAAPALSRRLVFEAHEDESLTLASKLFTQCLASEQSAKEGERVGNRDSER